jgi:hypothetical protein
VEKNSTHERWMSRSLIRGSRSATFHRHLDRHAASLATPAHPVSNNDIVSHLDERLGVRLVVLE